MTSLNLLLGGLLRLTLTCKPTRSASLIPNANSSRHSGLMNSILGFGSTTWPLSSQ